VLCTRYAFAQGVVAKPIAENRGQKQAGVRNVQVVVRSQQAVVRNVQVVVRSQQAVVRIAEVVVRSQQAVVTTR
jgi:hypothetical protein